MYSKEEQSIYQARLAQIRQMQEPERSQALNALTMDYPGMESELESRVANAEARAQAAAPEGTIAGPSSNPFTQYVAANPLEHIAAGADKFMAQRERKEGRQAMKDLSKMQSGATRGLMEAGMMGAQAQALRGGSPGKPPGMTEEEWQRILAGRSMGVA